MADDEKQSEQNEEPRDQQVPFFSMKTPQVLLYSGVIGWTAFALISGIWVKKTRESNLVLKANKTEISRLENDLTSEKQNVTAEQAKVSEQKQLVADRDQTIDGLGKDLADAKQSITQAEKLLSETKQQHKKHYDALFDKAHTTLENLAQTSTTKENLETWASFLNAYPLSAPKKNEAAFSKIAEGFFRLKLYDRCAHYLKLSNNFDPELKARLEGEVSIVGAFNRIDDAFAKKQKVAEIETLLNTASRLVAELGKVKDQPQTPESLKKLKQYELLSAKLLTYRTRLVLEAPPKEAFKTLEKLVKESEKMASKADSTLAQRLHLLDSATKAFSLASDLGQKESVAAHKKTITAACDLVAKIEKAHAAIARSKGIVSMTELDALFMEGDSAQISKKATELEAIAQAADAANKSIFEAAAAGHRAAVLFEKSQFTNGRNLLSKSIATLKAICNKAPANTLAHFRLGVLYWMQGQLTTSKDVSFKALKDATAILDTSVPKAPVTEIRQIKQFLAIIQGDLGHLAADLGKKDDAKKHFTSALSHWKYVVDNWGATEETKEGIDYCSWRISKL